jgi:arylsulfatase A-like enzyme
MLNKLPLFCLAALLSSGASYAQRMAFTASFDGSQPVILDRMIGRLAGALAAGLTLGLSSAPQSESERRPDVLLIAIDDLNDWVGHLEGVASTPHIDRLAARGVAFVNAHAASPVCNPSRTAMLGGLRPTLTSERQQRWRGVLGGATTLPEHFAAAGYVLAGAGKVFHSANESVFDDYFEGKKTDPRPGRRNKTPFVTLDVPSIGRDDIFDWKAIEEDDAWMADHQAATWMAERLQRDDEQPLFAAIGFSKPHLPWYVPAPYFDLHPPASIRLPVVPEGETDDLPSDAYDLIARKLNAELVERDLQLEAVRAYLAAVSFVDAQVGRTLEALERSPRADRTIVVLVSDHGFHLGDKGHWRKFSLWERATRIPLVFALPGGEGAGTTSARAVDSMSIYPTLCELAGLAIPEHVQGVSVRTLLAVPDAPWPHAALTSYRKHRALRTDRWRLIVYANGGAELYDHDVDPGEHENLIGLYTHREVEAQLREQLKALVAD